MNHWDHKKHPTILFTCSRRDNRLQELLYDDYNFESCLRLLSLKDQLQVRNVKHNKQLALLSRLFMKCAVNYALQSIYLDHHRSLWEEIEFEYNEHGKPEIKGRPFAYNNSNSNDLSCIAILSEATTVGVDLSHEEQDSVSSTEFMSQFEGIFGGSERDQLNNIESLSKRYRAFNHLWTLKEAFTKYLGCGLNIDLSLFSFGLTEVPKNGCIPQQSDSKFTNYDIEWVECLIDSSKVNHDLLKLNPTMHCYSATLKLSDKLPVIASIMTNCQSKARGIHIDLYEILRDEII